MKKVLIFLSAFLFSIQASYSIEEVILDTVKPELLKPQIKEENSDKKSIYLFEEALTKHFDNSPIETMHFFGYYRAGLQMEFEPNDEDLTYEYSSINAGINGKFKDGNTYYEARLRFNPQHNYSFLQYLPSNIYIANKSIPHHTFILGHTRTPTGYEGGMSYTNMPFFTKAQISRNFGNVRKVGLRVKGEYDFIDYDLGGYSSDTYFRKFFPGAEFSGWATLKPLAKTDGQYGKLKLGGGITTGQNDTNYFVAGAYAGYEYKNFTADFEYAKANGYNGARTISTNHAEGFYTTLGYKITPKVQALLRYDQYTPNIQKSSDIRREYSAGINYFIKGQALKLILNYVFCQNDLFKDSHRIVVGTQILL